MSFGRDPSPSLVADDLTWRHPGFLGQLGLGPFQGGASHAQLERRHRAVSISAEFVIPLPFKPRPVAGRQSIAVSLSSRRLRLLASVGVAAGWSCAICRLLQDVGTPWWSGR